MLSGKCPGNNPENQDKVLGYQEGRYESRTDDGQEQFYKPCMSVLESVWLKLWGWDPSVFGLLKKLNSCNIECHKEQSDPCPAHGDQCSHAAVDQVRKLSFATMVSTMVTLAQHEHTLQHLLLPLTPRSVGHTLLGRTTPDRESLEPLNICSLLANS